MDNTICAKAKTKRTNEVPLNRPIRKEQRRCKMSDRKEEEEEDDDDDDVDMDDEASEEDDDVLLRLFKT